MNKDFLTTASKAAHEAGSILMSSYGQSATEFKNSAFDVYSVTTAAERVAEQKIVEILKAAFPEHGLHGEEGASENETAEYVWYIDPLDGTSNFLRNMPIFGVSIGLLHQGHPVAGVLYFPALDLLVKAASGQGAYANDKKISVSQRPLEQSLYFAGGVVNGAHQINSALSSNAGVIKIFDATAYELAKMAMGDAEIYYLVNSPHDLVAGMCIVSEAGGKVTDEQGQPWSLDSKMVLITNGVVHDQALRLLSENK